MDFKQVDQEFRQLKGRFRAGGLTEAEFKAGLEALMCTDEQGNWWMIGYETERWYRHDGTKWVPADPPGGPVEEPAPVGPSAAERTESESSKYAVGGPNMPKAGSRPHRLAPGSRPSFLLSVAVVLALLVGGYFALRPHPEQATLTATSTMATTIAAVPEPTFTERASATPSPTTALSATPKPTDIPQVHITGSHVVTLYRGPGTNYGEVASYVAGDEFTVLARDRHSSVGWLFCKSVSDGNEGWLYFEWIDSDFDLRLVPTAASVPPSPIPTAKPTKDSCYLCG